MPGRETNAIRIEADTNAALKKLAARLPQFSAAALGDALLREAVRAASQDAPAVMHTLDYVRNCLGFAPIGGAGDALLQKIMERLERMDTSGFRLNEPTPDAESPPLKIAASRK